MKDIIIIGGGVIGSMIARDLAKYNLNILVLEKENDVGDGASGANSAIIHSGYDPVPGSLQAKLNVQGNKMYDQICSDLDVQFMRIGSITIANDDDEEKILKDLCQRSKENNVPYQLLNHDELKKIEPNITDKVKMGMLAPTAGVINPFELVVALMENAMENGVELKLNQEVNDIKRKDDYFVVKTQDAQYEGKLIINASGVYSDKISELVNPKFFTIKPRRGEYYVLDHFDNNYVNHVLFNVPSSKGKGVLITPTTHYNFLVGPSSNYIDERDDVSCHDEILNYVQTNAYRLIDNLRMDQRIKEFSGIRATVASHDFIIEKTSKNFINVAGIQSPGLSSAPAISKMVLDMIPNLEKKAVYNPKRRPLYRLDDMSFEKRQKFVKENPSFGRVVCRCEDISAGEVVDSIHRLCGATTVKGVKKRCRPGFGKCQGGFCQPLIIDILSRELNEDKKSISLSKSKNYILFDEDKGEENEKI